MKSTVLGVFLLSCGLSAAATESPEPATSAVAVSPEASAVQTDVRPRPSVVQALAVANADFCLIPGSPSSAVKYVVIKELKVGKGTYGGVTDVLPVLVKNARAVGADAMMDYAGSQRFGFWPWRLVRPIVRGVAIKWIDPVAPDCPAVGGTTLATVLASNQAPQR